MVDAVYARQSVEKKNSISIEGQIELCRRSAGKELQIYQDRGYSGKNTERPAFRQLMKDIQSGKIGKLYVYRLDRFSRSVADFGNLWEILQENNVEFVSVSENFDTTTPMGRAMLHIIMVFAQLERETTAERVKDNYYRRAALGSWPGGPAPYGFSNSRTAGTDGRQIPCLAANEHADTVRRIFELYAKEDASLGSVAKALNQEGIPAPKRETWDNVALSRILHCPTYVCADEQIYLHYKGLGANVTSHVEDFDGIHSVLLVGKRDRSKKKYSDVKGQSVSILNSVGLLSSDLWLACQNKLLLNQQLKNSGKGTSTWLTGLLKCGRCGYSVKVLKDGTIRRLICSGRYNLSHCDVTLRVKLAELENAVAEGIGKLLEECPQDDAPATQSKDEHKVELEDLDRRAARLLDAFVQSDDLTAGYLQKALTKLEQERQTLLEKQKRQRSRPHISDKLVFSELSFEEKKIVASQFIRRIDLYENDVEICWNV